MPKSLSMDLRERVVRAIADGASRRQAAARFGVSVAQVPAAYSPDFNPIENAFAKFKAFLRKEAARIVDDLWNAIAEAVDILTPAECANMFAAAAAAGYDAT